MGILHNRILWQVLLGAAALVCFVTTISWIRAVYTLGLCLDARNTSYKQTSNHPDSKQPCFEQVFGQTGSSQGSTYVVSA